MPPSLAHWPPSRWSGALARREGGKCAATVEAGILPASECGFQPPAPGLPALDANGRSFESVRGGGELDGPRLPCPGADDDQRQTVEGIPLRGLEGFEARGIAVVRGHDFARAFNLELDVVLRARHQ